MMTNHKMQPIWDSSVLTNKRYRALINLGPYISKGSIFEITSERPAMGIRPAHCTVHLLGSTLKLYITKTHLEAIKHKLEAVYD